MSRCADPSTQPRLRLPLLHQLCKFVPISSCQFASISDPQNLPVVVCLTNSVQIRFSVPPTLPICVYLYLVNSALLCLCVDHQFAPFASISAPLTLSVCFYILPINSARLCLSQPRQLCPLPSNFDTPTLPVCVYFYPVRYNPLRLLLTSHLCQHFFQSRLPVKFICVVSISSAPPCLFASISAPTPLPVFRLSCPPAISVIVNLFTKKFELISSTSPISAPKRLFTSIYIRQQYPIPPISATLHLSVYVYICPSTSVRLLISLSSLYCLFAFIAD